MDRAFCSCPRVCMFIGIAEPRQCRCCCKIVNVEISETLNIYLPSEDWLVFSWPLTYILPFLFFCKHNSSEYVGDLSSITFLHFRRA